MILLHSMVIVRPDCFTVPYTPRGTLSYRSSEDIVRGFGFVEFENVEDAAKAIEALNETEFEGRTLRVNEARPRQDRPKRGGGGGGYKRY